MTKKLQIPKRIRNHVNPLADQAHHEFKGFRSKKPIVVDIGAYRGEFSQQLLEKFGKEYNYLVCEIRKPYAKYLSKLFRRKRNVAVFDGDSSRGLKELLLPSIEKGREVKYIFINFPDPWFKAKHHKRRILSPWLLKDLEAWLPKETKIVFQTDQEQLFEDTKEYLGDAGLDFEEFDSPLWNIQTYWETMKIGEGSKIYRLAFSV